MKWINQFSRITTSGRAFLPQVDGLRFVAIIAVIAFHVRAISSFHMGVTLESAVGHDGLVNLAFESGHFGVQLFFAISGFILGVPFAEHYLKKAPAINLGKYYLRRLTRLEPPYIINLAFSFLLCWLVFRYLPMHSHLYHQSDWASYAGEHILASLVYCNGFIFASHPYPNIVLWSLEIEVQFYLLAPFIAYLFTIPTPWIRRGAMIALIVADSILTHAIASYWVWASLLGSLQFFLVGFLVCDLYLTHWVENNRKYIWDVLFILAGLSVILFHREAFFPYAMPWLIFIGVAGAFRSILSRSFLSLGWVATIGGMCYTIYMYHWFMISALVRPMMHLQTHIFSLDLIILLVAISAVIIPACAILFLFLERPFMQRNWPVTFRNHLCSWRNRLLPSSPSK